MASFRMFCMQSMRSSRININSRNVDEISGMKDFLLIQLTTSQCVNPVNTSDSFDKWRRLKHEGRRSDICYREDISVTIHNFWSFTHSFRLTENLILCIYAKSQFPNSGKYKCYFITFHHVNYTLFHLVELYRKAPRNPCSSSLR